jgi:hypothetical protein
MCFQIYNRFFFTMVTSLSSPHKLIQRNMQIFTLYSQDNLEKNIQGQFMKFSFTTRIQNSKLYLI